MNSKVKAFKKIFGREIESKKTSAIARVSDLIEKGFETDLLADEFIRIIKEVWGNIIDSQYIWTKEMLMNQFRLCPHLLYCAFENGEIVATASGIFTTEEDLRKHQSWLEKTGDGYYTTHKPDGNVGFGADLSVLREAVKKTSDKILFTGLLVTILGEGLKSLYLGSRIPSYYKYKHEDYVFGKRKSGKPLDPELYFYQKLGFEIIEIIPEYMEDPESLNCGVLIRWNNPLYKITKTFPFLKSVIKYVGERLFIRVPEPPCKTTVEIDKYPTKKLL
jgi:hypothetical protein